MLLQTRRPQPASRRARAFDVLAEIPEGPPARFTWRHVTRRVIKAEGPERIAPEWWLGRQLPPPLNGEGGWLKADRWVRISQRSPAATPLPEGEVCEQARARDYYRIEDEDGRRYWVFRDGLYQESELWVSPGLVSAWGLRVTTLARVPSRYAELDVTTNFTFLRGGSHPEELVATAKALGLDAIAVTDINTLAGVVRGHLAQEVGGIKFIVGARLDLQDAPSLLAFPRIAPLMAGSAGC